MLLQTLQGNQFIGRDISVNPLLFFYSRLYRVCERSIPKPCILMTSAHVRGTLSKMYAASGWRASASLVGPHPLLLDTPPPHAEHTTRAHRSAGVRVKRCGAMRCRPVNCIKYTMTRLESSPRRASAAGASSGAGCLGRAGRGWRGR